MNILRLLLPAVALLALAGTELRAQVAASYDDVMVLVNDRSHASSVIGQYFAQRRGIPDRHICRINVDSSETIDSLGFLQLRWKIKDWMVRNNLVDSINYIVTTKGCPLRVRTAQWDVIDQGQLRGLGGQASFEDCIALMNDADSSLALAVKSEFPINPYYGSTLPFKRSPDRFPMYLVTRLDAYTIDQVRSIIQRAEQPAFLGDGVWVLDIDPTKDGSAGYKVGNDWLRGADTILRSRGLTVHFNGDTAYVRGQTNVIGYGSWGSNDAYSRGRDGAIPGNTWLNGSIAETFVSTGGRTFNRGTTGGQSLIADWLNEGANGVKGYTDEPYLSAIAHPDILMDRYTSGYNLAESFWAASIFRAWRQVVIGDPKMRLGSMISPRVTFVDFASHPRFSETRDTIRLANNTSNPVLITALRVTGANANDFRFELLSGIFPETIGPSTELPVQVIFNPKSYGSRNATLVVDYRRESAPNTFSVTFPVTGDAMVPELSMPTSYDFGAVALGESSTHTIEVASLTAADTVNITRWDKTGTSTSRFQIVSDPATMPARLYGDNKLRLTVTYSPSQQTQDSMTLSLYHQIPGQSRFRIQLYGTGALAGVEDDLGTAGTSIVATPNPFTDHGELELTLAHGSHVRIELYDASGRSVLKVADGAFAPGVHRLPVDGAGLAAGTYLFHLTATDADGHAIARAASVVKR